MGLPLVKPEELADPEALIARLKTDSKLLELQFNNIMVMLHEQARRNGNIRDSKSARTNEMDE